MAVFREIFTFNTTGRQDMHDITAEINAIIARSGIRTGICHVFNIGSTGIISTIEFEPGLEDDFPRILQALIPPSNLYGHEQAWHDGNGHSHLQSTLVGPEITLPVDNGKLDCGVWQQVFHYEADIKPHQRDIVVTVIGE